MKGDKKKETGVRRQRQKKGNEKNWRRETGDRGNESGDWRLVLLLHFRAALGIFIKHFPSRTKVMTKLIALYRKPADAAAFDSHYRDTHTPLVRKYPGLRKLEITRITGAPIGETKFHLMAEMYFDNKAAMDAALVSPEGKAVARDLMSFAADVVTVFQGESD
jgi:uncharacterized protein (TIGR02118 family)